MKKTTSYLIKGINPRLWTEVKLRAKAEKTTVKAVILRSLISYVHHINNGGKEEIMISRAYKDWPRKDDGILSFANSEDAVSYGKIVAYFPDAVKELEYLCVNIRALFKAHFKIKDISGDELMVLATDGQFHREAYEAAVKEKGS